MKITTSILLFLMTLAACTPISTATLTTIPTFTIVPSLDDSAQEATPAIVAPTPMPTRLTDSLITPDSNQMEHWREYQITLAESLLFLPEETLCEWDILGASEQTLYLWIVCESILPFGATSAGRQMYSSSSTPAVVHLAEDGAIQNVEIPAPGISDYARLFPVEIQDKFEFYRLGRAKELSDHIQWRREHTEEPPLIVLSATLRP